jgi:hypothetical protein
MRTLLCWLQQQDEETRSRAAGTYLPLPALHAYAHK